MEKSLKSKKKKRRGKKNGYLEQREMRKRQKAIGCKYYS